MANQARPGMRWKLAGLTTISAILLLAGGYVLYHDFMVQTARRDYERTWAGVEANVIEAEELFNVAEAWLAAELRHPLRSEEAAYARHLDLTCKQFQYFVYMSNFALYGEYGWEAIRMRIWRAELKLQEARRRLGPEFQSTCAGY